MDSAILFGMMNSTQEAFDAYNLLKNEYEIEKVAYLKAYNQREEDKTNWAKIS